MSEYKEYWWAVPLVVLGPIVLIVGLALILVQLRPTIDERFDQCMAMAERSGLLEMHREDAALICLNNTTRRTSSGDDAPVIAIPTTGGQFILQ